MQRGNFVNRRKFLASSGAGVMAVSGITAVSGLAAHAQHGESSHPGDGPQNAAKIFKSVKWGMVQTEGSVMDKFRLQKELGFDGVELNSPSSIDKQAVLEASRELDMPVHGVVDSVQWHQRLSSPDPAIRKKGLDALRTAIDDSHLFGGSSVLFLPGKVSGPDETHDDIWKRSVPEIRKVLPQAAKKGIRILIENVWNGFCETPEQLCDYVDEFDSPWIGVYFDIGNVVKFSPSEQWIRTLGSRIVKLDVKDWGQENGFCKIGDGDVNWPAVREALAEIKFTGWCTGEVAGGDRIRLQEVAERMDRALGLAAPKSFSESNFGKAAEINIR